MSTAFSKKFSQLRHERGLSQRQVAADLDISQALLSHYENGLREPRIDFIVKICEYYGVSADYLFGRTKLRGDPGVFTEGLRNADVERLSRMIDMTVSLAETGRSRGKEINDAAQRYFELSVLKALLYMNTPYDELSDGMELGRAGLIRICDIMQMRSEALMGRGSDEIKNDGTAKGAGDTVGAMIKRLEPDIRKELGIFDQPAEGENR